MLMGRHHQGTVGALVAKVQEALGTDLRPVRSRLGYLPSTEGAFPASSGTTRPLS